MASGPPRLASQSRTYPSCTECAECVGHGRLDFHGSRRRGHRSATSVFDFFDILRENGRTLITNPLVLNDGRYTMDFADLERKAAAPQTKMIYLCNPHNPVARVWTADELRTLGDICIENGVIVVADEMHGDLAFPDHPYTPFSSLSARHAGNCITCLYQRRRLTSPRVALHLRLSKTKKCAPLFRPRIVD